MKDDTVKQAQQVMLSILLEFDAICKEHGLTYWLDHGTLLGAVRHQGFIPWDDDLDVTMPRDDYEKFIEVSPKSLPDWLFLQTKKSDPTMPVHYAKLRDRNSTYIDVWEDGKKIKYHQGIFIDIFPVNFIDERRSTRYKNLLNVAKIFSNRYIRVDWAANIFIDKLNKRHDKEENFIVSGGENMHYVTHVKKETVFPLQKIAFEGYEFPAPNDTHTYLSSIFGEGYMTLPPIENRKVHSAAIYIDKKCRYEEKHNER